MPCSSPKFFIVRVFSDEYVIGTTRFNHDPLISRSRRDGFCYVENLHEYRDMCDLFFKMIFPKIRLRVGEWCEVDLSSLAELVIIEEEVQP